MTFISPRTLFINDGPRLCLVGDEALELEVTAVPSRVCGAEEEDGMLSLSVALSTADGGPVPPDRSVAGDVAGAVASCVFEVVTMGLSVTGAGVEASAGPEVTAPALGPVLE